MTREEAIERLKQNKAAAEFYAGMVQITNAIENELKDIEAIDMAIEALRAEPKTGEWIKATGMMPPEFHGHHCCSECGNFANMEPPFGNREDLSNFCPNCGADMRNGM